MSRKKPLTINKVRTKLYKTAKILGDIQAILSPKPRAIEKRIQRRIVGKLTGRMIGKLFK